MMDSQVHYLPLTPGLFSILVIIFVVLIVGYSYGYFEPRDLVRMGAWLTVVEFIVLMLLVPFYWPLIGIR